MKCVFERDAQLRPSNFDQPEHLKLTPVFVTSPLPFRDLMSKYVKCVAEASTISKTIKANRERLGILLETMGLEDTATRFMRLKALFATVGGTHDLVSPQSCFVCGSGFKKSGVPSVSCSLCHNFACNNCIVKGFTIEEAPTSKSFAIRVDVCTPCNVLLTKIASQAGRGSDEMRAILSKFSIFKELHDKLLALLPNYSGIVESKARSDPAYNEQVANELKLLVTSTLSALNVKHRECIAAISALRSSRKYATTDSCMKSFLSGIETHVRETNAGIQLSFNQLKRRGDL